MPWPIVLAIPVVGIVVIAATSTDSLLGLPYAVVGAVLAMRRPAHPVGWILLAIGLATVIGTGSWLVVTVSALGLSVGWAGVAALTGGSVAFGLPVPPDGRIPLGATAGRRVGLSHPCGARGVCRACGAVVGGGDGHGHRRARSASVDRQSNRSSPGRRKLVAVVARSGTS